MRRISIAVLALLVLAQMTAFAETVTAPSITVDAKVADTFTIKVDLRRDVSGFPDLADDTKMSFGTLALNAGGTLIASEGVVAFITTNSHKKAYTVSSAISTALTSGAFTIPNGAFVLNNAYAAADNGGKANEGTVNAVKATAVATYTLYTSGGTHSLRTIQAHYTITDDPALGATSFVPPDQQGGTYTTTLTISATR